MSISFKIIPDKNRIANDKKPAKQVSNCYEHNSTVVLTVCLSLSAFFLC